MSICRSTIVLMLAGLVAACGPAWKHTPHDRQFQSAAEPALHTLPPTGGAPSDWWDLAYQTAIRPLAVTLSPARYLDKITDGRPALDVNAFGEVPDSTWYENRITRRPIGPEELQRGGVVSAPPKRPFTVVSGKLEGVTPGVVVRDANDVLWFVKFDPPAFPQLATGAEIVAARLLWASGYHIPEMHIEMLSISKLALSPDARTRDDYNRKVKLTAEALSYLLTNLNADSDGRLRGLFSRQLPGRALGPFSYRGVRDDDPNDRIPHERRRSLRGLWMLAAWLNNTDVRQQNTLDTFITVDEHKRLGYIKHFLLDFGDSLGSGGDRVKFIGEGYEKTVDWGEMGKRLISFGFLYPYWLPLQRTPFRSVGVFEAEVFDPARWKPVIDNPAFDDATKRDTFWGATILARFDRERIEAAVAAAQYSEPRAAKVIVDVLLARREKLLRYAFASMLGIDDPTVHDNYRVEFMDLEEFAGLVDAPSYRWQVRWNRSGAGDVTLASGLAVEPAIDLRQIVRKVMDLDHNGFIDDPFLTLTIERAPGRGPTIDIHLRAAKDRLIPVALSREID